MNFGLNRLNLFSNQSYVINNSVKRTSHKEKSYIFSNDSISISPAGRQMSASRTYTSNLNRMVDKSIDLQSYIDKAKKNNEENLKQAGTKIFIGAVEYTDTFSAMRGALKEKYSKLVSIAKTHSNPRAYITQKYNQYVKDGTLSKSEADIGRGNEISMLEKGDVTGVAFGDSLFRGIDFDVKSIINDSNQFKRRIVNKQIENIFEKAGISKEDIGESLSFKVDPYNYKITISGVDDNIKSKMEQALNVGENGEYLFYHISHSASRDGANSVQLTKDGKMKYRAYHNVLDYTGLKLNQLEAKGNTFYTKDNKDLKELISKAIDDDPIIPKDAKKEYKQIQFNYLSKIAMLGWNNIVDMPLKILYKQNGLVDFGQDIIFDGHTHMFGKQWYSIL